MDPSQRLPKGSFFPRRTSSLRAQDAPKASPLLRRISVTHNNLTAAFRNNTQRSSSENEIIPAESTSPPQTPSPASSSFHERQLSEADVLSPRLASLRRDVLPEDFSSPPGRVARAPSLPTRTASMRRAGVPGQLLIPASESPSRENLSKAIFAPRSSSLRSNFPPEEVPLPQSAGSSRKDAERAMFTPRSSSLKNDFPPEEVPLPQSATSTHTAFSARSSSLRRDAFDENRPISPSSAESHVQQRPPTASSREEPGSQQFLPRKSSLNSLPGTPRRIQPWSQHFSARGSPLKRSESPFKRSELPQTIRENVPLPLSRGSGKSTFFSSETSGDCTARKTIS